jgi:hypothetical protein
MSRIFGPLAGWIFVKIVAPDVTPVVNSGNNITFVMYNLIDNLRVWNGGLMRFAPEVSCRQEQKYDQNQSGSS